MEAEPPGFLCCNRCGHAWKPAGRKHPRRCPSCHSSRWEDGVRHAIVCRHCGTSWIPGPASFSCPNCGRSPVRGTLSCIRCGYSWTPRSDRRPFRCPSCHTIGWDSQKVEDVFCKRCGHTWTPQVEHPKRCPSCQSLRWDSEGSMNHCMLCGHDWFSVSGPDARRCPSCKRTGWKG